MRNWRYKWGIFSGLAAAFSGISRHWDKEASNYAMETAILLALYSIAAYIEEWRD